MNQIFDKIVRGIVTEQEKIVGPLAWAEARKVKGIRVIDQRSGDVSVEGGSETAVIDELVGRYERLFGKTAQRVSKRAVAKLLSALPKESIPTSLA